MKEKSALMLRGVQDNVTRRKGKVSGYQNNIYRVEFSNGESVLRHRNEITETDYYESGEHTGPLDPSHDSSQQRISAGCYRRRPHSVE
jgi:hypothetical protein